MSGARAQHLERRFGIYGLRVRVPDDIRPLVGMVEVRRSLRTFDPFLARAQSALIAARLFEVFGMVRVQQNRLSRADVEAMIADLFRDVADRLTRTAPLVARDTSVSFSHHSTSVGPTVGDAIDEYLRVKQRSWTPKTHLSRQRQLAYLREHLTTDFPLAQVGPDDVRSFRDAVSRLRVFRGRVDAKTFEGRQTTNVEHQIGSKTASLIFETTKAFFRWCKSEQGYLATNPAEDIRVASEKKPKGKKARRPFTTSELRVLFSAPLFTGCLSRHRRFDAGNVIVRDAKFWLPVLGYYTGARLGELVQLHVRDVQLDGDVPFLDVTDDNAGALGSGEAKHIKSQAGVRRIPLHPDVLTLGFAEFVVSRRSRGRSKRLFFEIPFGQDGQASTVFSKFFGRVLDRVGLTDPALVFHSFRHGAEDAFRNAQSPQYVIDRILGHSDGATSSRYGEGVSLNVAHQAVLSMKIELSLPPLYGAEPAILAQRSVELEVR